MNLAATKVVHHAAVNHHAPPETVGGDVLNALLSIVSYLVVFGLIVWAIIAFMRFKTKSKINRGLSEKAARREMFSSSLQTEIVPIPCPLILNAGESCYFVSRAIEYSVHTSRQYGSTYGGPSVRVARGIYLRTGVSRGSSHSVSAIAPDGAGMLYVTDRRFIFVGGMRTEAIDFKKIIQITPLVDGVTLAIVGGSPISFETGDLAAYLAIMRIMRGAFAAATPEESEQQMHDFDNP